SIAATTSIATIIIITTIITTTIAIAIAITTTTITRQTTVHLYTLGELTTYTLFLLLLSEYKKGESNLIAIV
ncbi:MAG: hypothetical protein QOK72_10875, partial [Nitrososphaeraceae archaeon]|nr:hypothetical protein [Nitrososphaeraceae archaeon]